MSKILSKVVSHVNKNFIKHFSSSAKSKVTKSYTKTWLYDKFIVFSMLPFIPISYYTQSSTIDTMIAIKIAAHMHHGIESITTDYIRKFPNSRKLMIFVLSATVLFGLLHHVHIQGNGIVMTLQKIWTIAPYKESDLDGAEKAKDSYIEDVIKYVV